MCLLSHPAAWAAIFGFFANPVIHIGSASVHLAQIHHASGPAYFHPHENEHTSAVVTRSLIAHKGGTLLEIQSQGTRLITFNLNGTKYTFDPNRMFTGAGLPKSLANYGASSPAAVNAVIPLRDAVLNSLKRPGRPIVAVHNNAPDRLSVDSYAPNGNFAAAAQTVAKNPARQPHDFFLVLDERLFGQLKQQGFNVVLQAPTAPDDGSLSVYCQMNHLRYINIEAGEGHVAEQKRMLEALLPLL